MRKDALLIFGLLLAGGGVWFYLQRKKKEENILIPTSKTDSNPISDIIKETSMVIKQMTNAGIRNNNPLNIDYNPNNKWEGQTGQAGRFAVFSDPVYGVRAAAKILNTYHDKYKINTIAGIVGRWAPPNENETKNYINFVAKETGILAFSPITKADYPKILRAMARMETGKDYGLELMQRGVAMAG